MESDLTSVVNGISSPPGVLAPFHWTMSSPVAGLDSRLRSVGGDRAGNKKNSVKDVGGTKATGGLEAKKGRSGKRWFILTCDNPACDWGSLLLAVYDRLDTVRVLYSRGQTRNVNTPRVRVHISGGFSALTGTYRQLKDK